MSSRVVGPSWVKTIDNLPGAEADMNEILWEVDRACRDMGFDSFAYGMTDTLHAGAGLDLSASNAPLQWHEEYVGNGYVRHDLRTFYCLNHTSPALITEKDHSLSSSAEARNIYERGVQFGVCSSLVFPLHGAGQDFGGLTLNSARVGRQRQTGETWTK